MPDRILIVEDEQITAEDLSDILKAMGYEVTAAVASGVEAIEEVERNPPDIALMDIRIKGELDGTETARILSERFDIPVIYLTAHADSETVKRAKRARPLGYIVKPFQESEVQAAVEIALHRHRQDRRYKERQEHLSDVLGNLLLGIISVDGSEVVLVFNQAAEQLTGWAKEDAVGGSIREVFRLIDLKTGQAADLPLDEVLAKGELAEIREGLLVNREGKALTISGNLSPVRGANGGISGAVIVFECSPASPEDPYLAAKLRRTAQVSTLQFDRYPVIANSDSMKKVLSFARRVARSEASTILIEGESGTGKDLLAKFLHSSSNRLSGPFLPVNCSAIPDSLIESELFGHEKGAFTDARADKKGVFELADGGTLFLDEVGELSPTVQAKMLRVLEEQTFRRVGGTRDVTVDVRVIAATNRNLSSAVEQGRFRLDLFHRLSVIPINIPPLRERPADILPLANHFVRELKLKYKSNVAGISTEASSVLVSYDWPGNVRELRNVLERAVLVEETEAVQVSNIQFVSSRPPSHSGEFPIPSYASPAHAERPMSLKDSERSLIIRALESTGGNQTKAALLLGVTRDILRYRIKKLGLKIPGMGE
jgi:PAS domain S-box-containing protein